MSWRPFTPSHAIERVRLTFSFQDELPVKLLAHLEEKLTAERSDLQFTSVGSTMLQQLTLQIGPDGPSQEIKNSSDGFILEWRDSDTNKISSALSVSSRYVSFEASDYTRWVNFREKLMGMIPTVLRAAFFIEFQNISLEYWDRFIFDGDTEKADPTRIISNLEGVLHEDALSGKEIWHLHRGWFENRDNRKILMNHNVQSQDTKQVEGIAKARSISIYTKVQMNEPNMTEYSTE